MSEPKSERPSQMSLAQRVAFEVSSGKGCAVLTLEDGTVLHVHPIVFDVAKLPGTNEQNEPLYSVQAGLAVRLMKKTSSTEEAE